MGRRIWLTTFSQPKHDHSPSWSWTGEHFACQFISCGNVTLVSDFAANGSFSCDPFRIGWMLCLFCGDKIDLKVSKKTAQTFFMGKPNTDRWCSRQKQNNSHLRTASVGVKSWLQKLLVKTQNQQHKRFPSIKSCVSVLPWAGQPHQSIRHGLLVLVEVHEVLIVSCRREDSECGEHGEQEASGVTCTQLKHTHTSGVHSIFRRKSNLVAEAINIPSVSWYKQEKDNISTGHWGCILFQRPSTKVCKETYWRQGLRPGRWDHCVVCGKDSRRGNNHSRLWGFLKSENVSPWNCGLTSQGWEAKPPKTWPFVSLMSSRVGPRFDRPATILVKLSPWRRVENTSLQGAPTPAGS